MSEQACDPRVLALLASLLSPDNATRAQGEAEFTQLKISPDECVLALLQVSVAMTAAPELRQLASVLLRRVLLLGDVSMWPQLADANQETVKQQLFGALRVTGVPDKVRRCLSDIAGELGVNLVEEGQWPEILPFMFELVKSPDAPQRESSLRIFCCLARYLATLTQHFATFTQLLQSTMQDSSVHVKVQSFRALGTLVICIEKRAQQKIFVPLVPVILQELGKMVSAGIMDETAESLEVLVEMADTHPKFFQQHIAQVMQAMVVMSNTGSFDESVRQTAMEVLLTIGEKASAMCRKIPGNAFVKEVFPVCFAMLLDIDFDEDWETTTEDDDGMIYEVGLEAVDRLARSIGPNKTLPVAFEMMSQFLSQTDWKCKHAGLMVLSQISEVLPSTNEQLTMVTQQILRFLSDAHPRIRFAAINCIGQISSDHGPTFQSLFHPQVVPTMMQALDDPSQRVQAHACAAIINFVDMCQPELLTPYLQPLLGHLLSVIQSRSTTVQEWAVTAVASIADCTGPAFLPCYDTFMPVLKAILGGCSPSDTRFRMLRCKTLECVTMIGVSVGKEKFGPDALEVIQLLIQTQQTPLGSDDPQQTYTLQAWARICQCLGPDAVPYLNHLMPPLLAAAAVVAEEEVSADVDEDGDSDVEVVTDGEKHIRIRTSALEEKATACRMLQLLVSDLKEGCAPHIEAILGVMAPLLTGSIHDDIRQSALACMPALVLSAARSAGEAQGAAVSQLLEFVLGKLLEVLAVEAEVELIITGVQAVKRSIESARSSGVIDGPLPTLSAELQGRLMQGLWLTIQACMQRRALRAAIQQQDADEFDEEEQEKSAMQEQEDYDLFFNVSDCVGTLLKANLQQFMPGFREVLLPRLLEMLHPQRVAMDRNLSVWIYDDLLEFGGAAVAEAGLIDSVVPGLIAAVETQAPPLRQAAVYGLGMAAKNTGAAFQPYLAQSVAILQGAISAGDARSEEMASATDNAVSALGLIAEHHDASLTQQWLAHLPLRSDKEESGTVATRLCAMVENNNAAVLEHLPQVAAILLETSGAICQSNTDLKQRVKNLMSQMQAQMPQEKMMGIWNVLSADQKGYMKSL